MPSSSWRGIERRWLVSAQPGTSAADMALCVPGKSTLFTRRPHSSRMPLQPAPGLAATAAGCSPRSSTNAAVMVAATAVSTATPATAAIRRTGRARSARRELPSTRSSSELPRYTSAAPPT